MNLNFYKKALNLTSPIRKTLVLLASALCIFNASFGQGAGALRFDGTDDFVTINVNPALNISSAITIETWFFAVKPPRFQNVIQNVISKATDVDNNAYIFPRTSDGWQNLEFLLYLNGQGWQTLSVPFGTTKLNQWHHVAATYDGAQMKVYIDGVLSGTLNIAGTISVNNEPLTLGNHPGFYFESFLGSIDEVRIWNRSLSQCEIGNNKNCSLVLPMNGLAVYYKLDQGNVNADNSAVTTLLDETSNQINGSLINFALNGTTSNWVSGTVITGACSVVEPVIATASSQTPYIAINETINLFGDGGGSNGTYSWVGPNGFTSNLQNPTIPSANVNASGTYTVTVSLNGCNSTATVNVQVVAKGGSLNFDGNNDYVIIPNSSTLSVGNTSNKFSIETWVKPTSSSPAIQTVATNSTYSNNRGFVFPRTDDGWQTFTFWLNINNVWRGVSAPIPSLGSWYHLAAVYDGKFMRIYRNGALVNSLAVNGNVTSSSNSLTLGNQIGMNEYFSGSIDEMRFWNRALPECEIVNNLNCELSGNYGLDYNGLSSQDALAGYFRFNQGLNAVDNTTITSLVDSSGNNNHGSLIDFTLNGTTSNFLLGNVINQCTKYVNSSAASITSNGPIVEVGTPITLSATGGTTYEWTGPNGFTANTADVSISTAQINQSGNYSVVISGNGCSSSLSTIITVAYRAGTLDFDGSNDLVTVPVTNSLNIDNNITLEAWINPTSNSRPIQDVMSKSTRTNNTGYIFPRTDDGWQKFYFYLHLNGTWQILSAPYPSLNEWHHVAATYDGYYMRIYLDGVLAGTKQVTGNITINSNNLVLGQQPGYLEYFKGQVDEAKVWSRALNQCEIINNMNCELDATSATGLSAYYRFNQGFEGQDNTSVTTMLDESSNLNNGTLQDFALDGINSNWGKSQITGSCAPYTLPNVTASANGTVFAVGSNIKLYSSGAINGATYTWDGPNNFTTSIQNPTIGNAQIAESGIYTVTVPYVRCVITASTSLTVSNITLITADGPTTFCPSGSVTLSTNATGSLYQWYRNDILIVGANSNTYVATETGNYTISVTNGLNVFVSPAISVTVEDNLAPVPDVALLPDMYLILTGSSIAVNQIPTATDNCSGILNGTTSNAVVFNNPGTYQITWTYDDLNGHQVQQIQSVSVLDGIPPVINPLSNLTFAGNASLCGAVVNFTATATDNAGQPVLISYSPASGSVFNIGTTTVTVTAVDASNNVSTTSFAVTVLPTTVDPIQGIANMCVGGNLTVSTTSNGGTWSSDNLSVASINASGEIVAIGAGTSVISYTNACGATASATLTVNAIPSTPIVTVINNCGTSVLSTDAVGSLLWSNGATTSSITVAAGNYSVTTTENGCTSAAGSATANPTAQPTAPIVIVSDNCGSTVLSTNATGSLLWSTGETSSSISVGAGTYNVTATVNGCTSAAGIGIASPKSIPTAPVVTVSDNCGSSVLSTNAAGSILWSTGETSSSITVGAGTYSVNATVDGCTSVSGSGTATPKTIPTAPVVTVVDNCGSSILSTNATGSLLWSTGATTSSITVATAGNYSVTTTENGCTSVAGSATANPTAQPTAPIVTVSDNCGSTVLSTNASGSLLWSTGETSSSITVGAGTYNVTATVNGCTSAAGIGVASPKSIPTAPVVTVSDNCGSSVLSTNAVGSLLWSNGATSSSITVGVGTYSVTATVDGCTSVSGSGTATPKTIPTAPVVTVVDNCGSSILSTNATGSLLWSTGATTSSITVATAGNYSVTTTENGCTSAAGSATANPTAQPTAPIVTVSDNCGSTVLSTNASGSLLWSTGETSSSITVGAGTYNVTATVNGCTSATGIGIASPKSIPTAPVITVADNCGSSVLSTNATGSLLWSNGATSSSITVGAGTFSVTATINGCTSVSGSGTATPKTIPTAPIVTVVNNCGNSILSTNATGSLLWSTGATTSSITVVTAGNYSVTSTENGCTSVSGSGTATPKTIPTAPIVTVVNNCGSSLLSTNATGSLLWSNGSTSASINVTNAGTYSVTTTINGCTSAAGSGIAAPKANVATPLITVINNCGNSTLSTSATGNILWSNSATTSSINVTQSGNYSVTVTAANGCSASSAIVSVTVNVNPTLGSIAGASSVNAGSNTQLTNSTAGGVWSSSNTAVATINSNGLVSGLTSGTSVISYTVTNIAGCTSTVSFTISVSAGCVTPVATITASAADAFCNKLTLTANSSVNNVTYKWMFGSTVVGTSQQLELSSTQADGVYTLVVTANSCISAPVTYNFQKQNQISNYTILASKEVSIGKYNKVLTGSVGVTTYYGKAKFESNSSVSGAGSFVKSPRIERSGSSINLNSQVYGIANVILPAMQYNTSSTRYLPSYYASNSVTLSTNYGYLIIKKGVSVVLTGNTYGTIKLEEGASVRFTNSVLNIDNLIAEKGAKNNQYTLVKFAPNTSVRVSSTVSFGSHVLVNPDSYKVTFYMGDSRSDEEKFTVKGGDTKVIANIYMPNGKLKVTATESGNGGGYGDDDDDDHGDHGNHGDDDDDDDNRYRSYSYNSYNSSSSNCDHRAHSSRDCKHKGHGHNDCNHSAHNAENCGDDVYMTGQFIVEDLESNGNMVIWNSYNCSAPTPMVIATSNAIITNGIASEKSANTATTEEALKITVMPNPSTTVFTLKFESKFNTPVNMRVMDANGRVVDAKSNIGANSTIQIGANYTSGTYYAEMIQGATRKVVQLIKVRG